MSRILLLLIFLIWLAWTPGKADHAVVDPATGAGIFLGVLAALVLILGLWSRTLARALMGSNLHQSLRRFNRMMLLARAMIPAWFAFGMFGLGWGHLVLENLGAAALWPVELPAIVIGTLPAFAAWMGLWWSQYPADRAFREQSLLIQLDEDLPVHAPPGFWGYFAANLRLQLLFLIVPVLLILAARDLVVVGLWQFGVGSHDAPHLQAAAMFTAAGVVFLLAPVILCRVLQTRPLPASPLRRRLEALCTRHGLRYRDILLWQTQNSMGNAAVMGVVPPVRYILLSDLLLETMTDEQIEAVFAHELGHIMHRHMSWYVIFVLILMLGIAGPGTLLQDRIELLALPPWLPLDLVAMLMGVGMFLLVFGYLSRRFERQADVFAARTMQENQGNRPVDQEINQSGGEKRAADPRESYVGPYGATVFASALQRVATINNIPVSARSWCHGSIAKRMGYLRSLSLDPSRTAVFDRFMQRLYLGLLTALAIFGTWVAVLVLT